jgi:hypothetical protein
MDVREILGSTVAGGTAGMARILPATVGRSVAGKRISGLTMRHRTAGP